MKTKTLNIFRIFIVGLIIAVIATLIFYGIKSTSKKIKRVLLISLDTCRADYLSCYGFKKNTTPNIDAIAKQGVLFKNVTSPVPLTRPAHASMLTGTIPPYHGIHDNARYILADSAVSLAELLKAKGLKTAGIVSSFVLDSQFGMAQGFDYYNDKFEKEIKTVLYAERRGDEATRFACQWLDENNKKPFFLFLHYYDPHLKYNPPEPFKSEYADDLYAGEIAYTDYCVGQVIDKLKTLGIYDSTLIIITSDHGESLGEHGESNHGFFIYDCTVKVPLVIKMPNGPSGIKVDNAVGLIDIMPTVLQAMDMEIPPQVQGKSLLKFLEGKKSEDKRAFYCESLVPTQYELNPLLGLVNKRFKYIQTSTPELYDLENDPCEITNIIDKHTNRARIMQDDLKKILETYHRDDMKSETMLDPESKARLEALGYVADSKLDDSFEFDQTKPDAKEYIQIHRLYSRANTLLITKKYSQLKIVCDMILKINSDFPPAYRLLGKAAYETNQYNRAIRYYYKYIDLVDDDYMAYNDLGAVLSLQDEFDEALEVLNRALKLKEDVSEIHINLAVVFENTQEPEKAIAHYRRAIELNPNKGDLYYNLGVLLQLKGQLTQAVTNYQKAIAIDPNNIDANYNIATVYYAQNKILLTIRQYKKVLQMDPEHGLAMRNLQQLRKRMEEIRQNQGN